MNPAWSPEQKALYRQLVAIIFGNLPTSTPVEVAIDIAKSRAIPLIEDSDLFPSS
jgi:hypothetical protein